MTKKIEIDINETPALKMKDARSLLGGISRDSVINIIFSGKLDARKINGQYRFKYNDLMRYLEECRVGQAADPYAGYKPKNFVKMEDVEPSKYYMKLKKKRFQGVAGAT